MFCSWPRFPASDGRWADILVGRADAAIRRLHHLGVIAGGVRMGNNRVLVLWLSAVLTPCKGLPVNAYYRFALITIFAASVLLVIDRPLEGG